MTNQSFFNVFKQKLIRLINFTFLQWPSGYKRFSFRSILSLVFGGAWTQKCQNLTFDLIMIISRILGQAQNNLLRKFENFGPGNFMATQRHVLFIRHLLVRVSADSETFV